MALFKRSAAKSAPKSAKTNPAPPEAETGPATVVTDVIIADIAMRAAEAMLRRGVDLALPGSTGGTKLGGGLSRSLGARVIRFAALRVATRSVPGAIVVGGALVAKSLYDRRRARAAKKPTK